MINTYQNSVVAPPVPPRLGSSGHVLVPAPVRQTGHSKAILRFLVAIVLLHLLLSVAGFIFIYHNGSMVRGLTPEAQVASLSAGDASSKPVARMVVKQPPQPQSSQSGYLQWNMDHSMRRNVKYISPSWLLVVQPGDYFVYSRVTFSRRNPERLLSSWVKLKKGEATEEQDMMKAYCSLDERSSNRCTATQGEIMTLEAGAQLSVWVSDLSCVNYDEGATSFGMYKL